MRRRMSGVWGGGLTKTRVRRCGERLRRGREGGADQFVVRAQRTFGADRGLKLGCQTIGN